MLFISSADQKSFTISTDEFARCSIVVMTLFTFFEPWFLLCKCTLLYCVCKQFCYVFENRIINGIMPVWGPEMVEF